MMTIENKKKKLLIAIPHEGWIKPQLAIYLWGLLRANSDYHVQVTFYSERPIQQNYHKIVKDFLNGDADYLFILNADIVPSKNILYLLDGGKDIIGLPVPTLKEGTDLVWLIMDKCPDGYKMKNLKGNEEWVECDAVGGGAIILSRKVLEKIERPFEILWNKDGLLEFGSDFNFCQRAKERGFKIWTHLQYKCSHYGDKGNLDYLQLNNLLVQLSSK